MPVTIEILPPERPSPTLVAAVQPTVTVIDAPSSTRGERRDPKTDRGVSFRAALDAATFTGVISGAAPGGPASTAAEAGPRPEKFPATSAEELSSGESTGLLGAVHATRGTDAPPAPEQDAHRAATQRYARTFFSDTRTFARPGESLEVSA
jgi:hypothetical protein